MLINYSYKFRIYPNKKQQDKIAEHFGGCRFVWNYFLDKRINLYKEKGKSMSYYDCAKELKQLKVDNPWLKNTTAQSLQASLENLDKAYTDFFRKNNRFPKFKSKKFTKQSYKAKQGVKILNTKIQLPKIGKIKCKYDREVEGKVLSTTISKNSANQFFASVTVEKEASTPIEVKVDKVVGIDLGIKDLAIQDDGVKYQNLKLTRKFKRKLKLKQRVLCKKKKGSNNRRKAMLQVAKLHNRISNKRQDYLQKLTTKIINENQVIIVEDLNVKGMMKNHRLAGSIGDASWSEFVRMLEYKAKWQSKAVQKIDRFYPTSKLCSACGFINQNLTLKDRAFVCPKCNHKQDRDIQAAQNIKTFGLQDILNQTTFGKRGCDDCGGYQLWQHNGINFLFACETVACEPVKIS